MPEPISWAYSWPYYVTTIVIAYVIGSIPVGLILVRQFGKSDIRKIGSGNIGATNVLRTGNKVMAFSTLLLDVGKGLAAVLIGAHYGPDLALTAGDLDGEALRLHVHDLGAEDVGHLHHLRTGLGIHPHPYHDQFTINILAVPKVLYLDRVDQLIQLLDDLVKCRVVATGDDRHAGHAWVVRWRDVEGVDVEPPAAKQPGNACQHAELVLNQH